MVEEKSFRVWKFNKHLKVDITGTIDQAFFNGKDVCEVLGYVNAKKALQEHLGEDEKKKYLSGTYFKNQLSRRKGVYISESSLHSLILRSYLPTAKLFKKWATSEVLPSIHKTGG